MKTYEVTFYRNLTNRSGNSYRSDLETLQVEGTDRRQAFCKATKRFAHDWSLYEWANLADACEVIEVQPDAPALPSSGGRTIVEWRV